MRSSPDRILEQLSRIQAVDTYVNRYMMSVNTRSQKLQNFMIVYAAKHCT